MRLKLPGRPRQADDLAPKIVQRILAYPHANETADSLARRMGVGDRHRLNRTLHRAGYPGFQVLTSFALVLALRDSALAHHRSLCAEVIEAGYDPAWAYRTFKRVTGRGWLECRSLSHDQLVRLVVGEVGADALPHDPAN